MCECDKQNKLATLFLGRKLNFPFCLQPLPSLWRCRCSAIVASPAGWCCWEHSSVFGWYEYGISFKLWRYHLDWPIRRVCCRLQSSQTRIKSYRVYGSVSLSSIFFLPLFRPFAQDKPHDMAICVIHVVPPGFSQPLSFATVFAPHLLCCEAHQLLGQTILISWLSSVDSQKNKLRANSNGKNFAEWTNEYTRTGNKVNRHSLTSLYQKSHAALFCVLFATTCKYIVGRKKNETTQRKTTHSIRRKNKFLLAAWERQRRMANAARKNS